MRRLLLLAPLILGLGCAPEPVEHDSSSLEGAWVRRVCQWDIDEDGVWRLYEWKLLLRLGHDGGFVASNLDGSPGMVAGLWEESEDLMELTDEECPEPGVWQWSVRQGYPYGLDGGYDLQLDGVSDSCPWRLETLQGAWGPTHGGTPSTGRSAQSDCTPGEAINSPG